jgi:DNA-binding FrmR family transcriptional regulator
MKSQHTAIATGLKKAKGMLDKVMQLIESDSYCPDIAQQINATIGLLQQANKQLLRKHIICCGKSKLTSKDSGEVTQFVDELMRTRDIATRK